MYKACATQDDAARDVDVIAGGNQIADGVKNLRHGLAWKDIAGEENARNKRQERKLHGLRLGVGLAGHQNADGQRNEKIR